MYFVTLFPFFKVPAQIVLEDLAHLRISSPSSVLFQNNSGDDPNQLGAILSEDNIIGGSIIKTILKLHINL